MPCSLRPGHLHDHATCLAHARHHLTRLYHHSHATSAPVRAHATRLEQDLWTSCVHAHVQIARRHAHHVALRHATYHVVLRRTAELFGDLLALSPPPPRDAQDRLNVYVGDLFRYAAELVVDVGGTVQVKPAGRGQSGRPHGRGDGDGTVEGTTPRVGDWTYPFPSPAALALVTWEQPSPLRAPLTGVGMGEVALMVAVDAYLAGGATGTRLTRGARRDLVPPPPRTDTDPDLDPDPDPTSGAGENLDLGPDLLQRNRDLDGNSDDHPWGQGRSAMQLASLLAHLAARPPRPPPKHSHNTNNHSNNNNNNNNNKHNLIDPPSGPQPHLFPYSSTSAASTPSAPPTFRTTQSATALWFGLRSLRPEWSGRSGAARNMAVLVAWLLRVSPGVRQVAEDLALATPTLGLDSSAWISNSYSPSIHTTTTASGTATTPGAQTSDEHDHHRRRHRTHHQQQHQHQIMRSDQPLGHETDSHTDCTGTDTGTGTDNGAKGSVSFDYVLDPLHLGALAGTRAPLPATSFGDVPTAVMTTLESSLTGYGAALWANLPVPLVYALGHRLGQDWGAVCRLPPERTTPLPVERTERTATATEAKGTTGAAGGPEDVGDHTGDVGLRGRRHGGGKRGKANANTNTDTNHPSKAPRMSALVTHLVLLFAFGRASTAEGSGEVQRTKPTPPRPVVTATEGIRLISDSTDDDDDDGGGGGDGDGDGRRRRRRRLDGPGISLHQPRTTHLRTRSSPLAVAADVADARYRTTPMSTVLRGREACSDGRRIELSRVSRIVALHVTTTLVQTITQSTGSSSFSLFGLDAGPVNHDKDRTKGICKDGGADRKARVSLMPALYVALRHVSSLDVLGAEGPRVARWWWHQEISDDTLLIYETEGWTSLATALVALVRALDRKTGALGGGVGGSGGGTETKRPEEDEMMRMARRLADALLDDPDLPVDEGDANREVNDDNGDNNNDDNDDNDEKAKKKQVVVVLDEGLVGGVVGRKRKGGISPGIEEQTTRRSKRKIARLRDHSPPPLPLPHLAPRRANTKPTRHGPPGAASNHLVPTWLGRWLQRLSTGMARSLRRAERVAPRLEPGVVGGCAVGRGRGGAGAKKAGPGPTRFSSTAIGGGGVASTPEGLGTRLQVVLDVAVAKSEALENLLGGKRGRRRGGRARCHEHPTRRRTKNTNAHHHHINNNNNDDDEEEEEEEEEGEEEEEEENAGDNDGAFNYNGGGDKKIEFVPGIVEEVAAAVAVPTFDGVGEGPSPAAVLDREGWGEDRTRESAEPDLDVERDVDEIGEEKVAREVGGVAYAEAEGEAVAFSREVLHAVLGGWTTGGL